MDQHVTGVLTLLLWFALDLPASQYTNCSGDANWIGDGFCNWETNDVACAYDGGDCCSCSCVDGVSYGCGSNGFNCSDPSCPNEGPSTHPNCTGTVDWIGDGWCDSETNNLACGFDGGDCCACTCMDGLSYSCGANGFACHDEACADPAIAINYPDCVGNLLSIGDGSCSAENNNEACGYDGGDCCLCTCQGNACGVLGFNCSDPAADDEFYDCKPLPPNSLPCPADGQRVWVVEDLSHANALAEGINCSGGSFDVLWNGKVVVDKTIYVYGGTILNITGVGSHANMDGNSTNQVLIVVNASVHLTGVNISHGAGTVGGAIAAVGSSLMLDKSSFFGNAASGHGGAIYAADGSVVSFDGHSRLSGNSAGIDGGAIYAADSSVVSFIGHTRFSGNTAEGDGGAVFLTDSLCGGENLEFFNNTAGGSGGAVMATDNASVSWSGNAIYDGNYADVLGGAICTQHGSSTAWITAATFQSNGANESAGALALLTGSIAVWLGEATFDANSARNVAGALLVRDYSYVWWNATTTFSSNRAGSQGGGIRVFNNASVMWDGRTIFVGNRGNHGGAMMIGGYSTAVCGGNTTMWGNTAKARGGAGGAVFVSDYSSASFNGDTVFVRNSAGYGGAVLAASGSNIAFGGGTAFHGNVAVSTEEPGILGSGAGVAVLHSTLTLRGETMFAKNKAHGQGGAVHAADATVLITGNSTFLYNSGGLFGGAVSFYSSNGVFDGNITFHGNVAIAGGAVDARTTSVEWRGNAAFSNNSGMMGGAFAVSDSSNVSLSATMTLEDNNVVENEAATGGGVTVTNNSTVFWSGQTLFINNSADGLGGAVSVWFGSTVYWSGVTTFDRCSAAYGGALFVSDGATVEWSGRTEFTSNIAEISGGAVLSSSIDGRQTDRGMTLIIKGNTVVANNTAAATGGGFALNGKLSITFRSPDVLFIGNSAGVAGGAVFVSGISDGPSFYGVKFVSNRAGAGGGAFITGSGNADVSAAGIKSTSATEFDGCQFVHNRATATGGAIESVAGQDYITNSAFVGNTAGVGGGVRLAGKTRVDNCSFEDNRSDEGDGPAIENVAIVLVMKNNSFNGNVFYCEPGKYLDFTEADNMFEVACKGCRVSCDVCYFDEALAVPICTQVMEHATSSGGATTLPTVSIDRGFWRATSTSRDILPCYRADACLGGVTASSGYCRNGYEGPYCSLCSDGYTEGYGFTCDTCPGKGSVIVLAAVLAVIVVIGAAGVASYTMSGHLGRSGQGTIERFTRFIPLPSIKIVVVAFQIVTQFTSIANITFPHAYQRFLDTVNFINFDLGWIFNMSAGCLFNVGIHGRLVIATIGPVIAAVFLGFTYVVAARRSRGSTGAMRVIRHRHVSMVLLLTFLVYSSVSSIIFQMFACDDLADGKKYLRADYRVECDSPNHVPFQIYAGFMMLLYTVGIPALYTSLLVQNRSVLKDEVCREENQRTRSFSDLWKPYKPSAFYYEVIECGRRVLLTGAVVFIYPNTSAQISINLVIAVFFGMVSESLSPFTSRWDTWISRMGHIVVCVSMYVALLLKVDVSDERSSSQKVFEVVLVAANLGMILAVIVESGVIVCSLRQTVNEGISPRFRGSSFPYTREIGPQEVVGPLSRRDRVDCANKAIPYLPWYA